MAENKNEVRSDEGEVLKLSLKIRCGSTHTQKRSEQLCLEGRLVRHF